MVFQEQSLLTNLTVGENIYLGNEAQLHPLRHRRLARPLRRRRAAARQGAGRRRPAHARRRSRLRRAADGRARQGADARGAAPAAISSSCSTSRPRCSSAPRSTILFARVRALKSRASFVFVSHRLDEVLELSDRIYVMKDGAVVADLDAAEADVTHAAPSDGRPRACRPNITASRCRSPTATRCVVEAEGPRPRRRLPRRRPSSCTPARSSASPASSAPAARS